MSQSAVVAGSHRTRSLAWCLAVISLLGLLLVVVTEQRTRSPEVGSTILGALPLIILPTCLGTLLALRQPSNPIGWLLTAGALAWLAGSIPTDLARASLESGAGASAATRLAINLDDKGWPLGVICSVGLPLLLFPDGRTRSKQGRWALRAMVAGAVLAIGGGAVSTDPVANPVEPSAMLTNPWAVAAIAPITQVIERVGVLLVIATTVAAVAGVVGRFRSVRGAERQQLRWVGFGATLASAGMLVFFFDGLLSHEVVTLVFTIGFGCLPLTFTVAILRYRLYELDRLVSRTVTYAAVTGMLVATYVGIVTAVSRLTPSSSSLSVAASTLAVAALFQPLRRRVQHAVDRRFNRARFDAEQTVDAFSRRLREQVSLDLVRAELLTVTLETMQPASAGLWLRGSPT